MRRSLVLAFAVLVLVTPAAAQARVKLTSLSSPTGTLELRATLVVTSRPRALCPPGTPGEIIECHSRTGAGVIPGLGRVSHSYIYIAENFVEVSPATCTHVGDVRILATTLRLSTVKGHLDVSLAAVPDCMHRSAKLSPARRAFIITGGTGIYAGASGGGTLKHSLTRQAPGGAAGTDTWAGTLVVPGLEFDVTPPQLTGAVARVVRAPRQTRSARVSFTVSARDDVDGSLPVTCTPRSGSRFTLGETRVTCSATDSGGNTATARFTVTVRARR